MVEAPAAAVDRRRTQAAAVAAKAKAVVEARAVTDSAQTPATTPPARPRPPRPSRRKRFITTLAATAAGFVIVFQFLALELQAGNDPAVGGALSPTAPASHRASAPTSSTTAPVVTRTSTGAQSTPVSNPTVATGTQAMTTHTGGHHTVLTSASGSGPGGQHDD